MSAALPCQSFSDSIDSPDISAPIDPSLKIQHKIVQKKTVLLSASNILLFVSLALLIGVLIYLCVPAKSASNNFQQTSKNIISQSKASPLPSNHGRHRQTPSGSGSKSNYQPSTTSPTDTSKATSSQISKSSGQSVIGGNPGGSGGDDDQQEDDKNNPNQRSMAFGGIQDNSEQESSSDDPLSDDMEQSVWSADSIFEHQSPPLVGATAP